MKNLVKIIIIGGIKFAFEPFSQVKRFVIEYSLIMM